MENVLFLPETDIFFNVPLNGFRGRFWGLQMADLPRIHHLSVSLFEKIGLTDASGAFFSIKRFPLCDTDKFPHLCQKLLRMKKYVLLLMPFLTMLGCQKSGLPEPDSRQPEGEIFHQMIQLGEKLDDPYTVANMQAALTKAYPTKAGRVSLKATDLYVRFLPKDDAQMDTLKARGLYLMDHPMDYRILREGDYYQDPDIGDDAITWQYSVVPQDFKFPEGLRYEVLDECYLADNDVTKADDINWLAVEEEAFKLTGNEDLWEPPTKAAAVPTGRITIQDPEFSGGKPFGVAGVQVVANIFVKIARCFTSRDGYYTMPKSFSGKPRYRLVFQNEKGFSIGFNFIIVPASVSTLGVGGPEGIDVEVKADGDDALFRRCVVNNAAFDFYSRCTETDLEIAPPPGDLRIWIFPGISASSACMLHHGAFLDNDLLKRYLGVWLGLIQIFLPDITIGTSGQENYRAIYSAVSHELAHSSHYAKVGNAFWSPYIQYIIQSFVTAGGQFYGTGTAEGSGYCEVGEMWGYFMQASLMKDRYKGAMDVYGNSFWFKPDIFTYLYERGMTRGEIYRALNSSAVDIASLKDELIKVAPGLEKEIIETFERYGK